MKNTWKILKHAIAKTHETVGIDKVIEGMEITDKNRLLKDVMSTLFQLVRSLPVILKILMAIPLLLI